MFFNPLIQIGWNIDARTKEKECWQVRFAGFYLSTRTTSSRISRHFSFGQRIFTRESESSFSRDKALLIVLKFWKKTKEFNSICQRLLYWHWHSLVRQIQVLEQKVQRDRCLRSKIKIFSFEHIFDEFTLLEGNSLLYVLVPRVRFSLVT